MSHPSSEKVYEISEVFLNLYELLSEDVKVDMWEAGFNLCGTVACHAGWWAIAQGKEQSYNYNFISASSDMAKFLDFRKTYELEDWAAGNFQIWGNSYGRHMFDMIQAFGKKSDEELTLKDISDHWLEVAKRLAKLEVDGGL